MIQHDNQPWTLAPAPTLEWLDATPRSTTFDDIYFSPQDGLAESNYVFIEGAGVEARIRELSSRQTLTITETGFGTGLNFLLTLSLWLRYRPPGSRLHYIGIDAYPLRHSDVSRALTAFPELHNCSQWLLNRWPHPVKGCHPFIDDEAGVRLDLWWEDATETLRDLVSSERRWVDIWYLDGFAPAREPALWSPALLGAVAALSKPEASFTTFTAAGDVKRQLQALGFEVTKRPGFGRKRDCLQGQFRLYEKDCTYEEHRPHEEHHPAHSAPVHSAPVTNTLTPWDMPSTTSPPNTALVIGAGLAGACVARRLAERGIRVTVLEAKTIASGGSSNLQGITYTRLSRKHNPLSDFSILSYLFATRHYQQLVAAGRLGESDGRRCGFAQLGIDAATARYLEQTLGDAPEFAQWLTPDTSAEHLGIALETPALLFPDAFWLNPPAVCEERLDHPLIEVIENTGQVALSNVQQLGERGFAANATPPWQATHLSTGKTYAADIALLANAGAALDHAGLDWLPLQQIRGQTSHMAASPVSEKLKVALCHEGYFPPARHGVHCMGASYGPNDTALDERGADHAHNLATLAAAVPALRRGLADEPQGGHVALRCTSTDYLPLAGSAPDRERFNTCYAALGQRKTQLIAENQPALTGLWLLIGLGSRGLCSAPLLAEHVASQICNDPPPLPRALARALSPARFLARALIRGNPL